MILNYLAIFLMFSAFFVLGYGGAEHSILIGGIGFLMLGLGILILKLTQ